MIDGWDRDLEGGLPDSRLVLDRRRTTVVLGRQLMERVYCANCGADGGLITADWCPHVFYLCDTCAAKHAGIELAEVPEPAVRGR